MGCPADTHQIVSGGDGFVRLGVFRCRDCRTMHRSQGRSALAASRQWPPMSSGRPGALARLVAEGRQQASELSLRVLNRELSLLRRAIHLVALLAASTLVGRETPLALKPANKLSDGAGADDQSSMGQVFRNPLNGYRSIACAAQNKKPDEPKIRLRIFGFPRHNRLALCQCCAGHGYCSSSVTVSMCPVNANGLAYSWLTGDPRSEPISRVSL